MRQPLFLNRMSNNTPRMIALLGAMRKQMNGAVADAMFYYGRKYGLNYGVSLPTIRSIASQEGCDHDLAIYLFQQQVRELQLAALHIADAQAITADQDTLWYDGMINSEIAEEMAFALLGGSPHLEDIFHKWIASENEYAVYAALMAAARSSLASKNEIVGPIANIVERFPESRIIAQGAVALLSAAYNHDAMRQCVQQLIASLPTTPAATYIADEMGWRMEF